MEHMTEDQERDALNEVDLTKKMKHPNVVTFHKTFEEGYKLNVVLEFCEQRDLDHYIEFQQGVPISESEIWQFFDQICLGLRSLHRKHILHRDIKTANIFLTGDGTVKIGDLGISRQMDHSKHMASTKMIGTLPYMSPEHFNGVPYG